MRGVHRQGPLTARARRLARRARVLSCAAWLASCGDYDPEPSTAAGGSTGVNTATGQLDTPARAGSTGSGGSTASGSTASGSGGTGSASVASVEAACTGVMPCGGDVVGTWIAAGSCLPVSGVANMSGFGLGCTAAPVTGTLRVTGTWTANADGTFTDGTTTAGDSQIQLPPECLNVSGTTTTCDRLDGALQALGYASVTCADAASGGCTCTATVRQTGGMAFVVLGAPASGMYTAANEVVAIAGRNPREYSYCVAGSTLTLTPQGMSSAGTLSGTIVFQKQ